MRRDGDLYRCVRAEDICTAEERSTRPADGRTRRQEQSHGLAPYSVSERDALMDVHVVEPRAALKLALRYQVAADGFRSAKRPVPQAIRMWAGRAMAPRLHDEPRHVTPAC